MGSPTTGGSINEVGRRFRSFKINDLEMVDLTGIDAAGGREASDAPLSTVGTLSTERSEGDGGPDRDRTGDLLNAIQARSQLRHWPTLVGRPVDVTTANFCPSILLPL